MEITRWSKNKDSNTSCHIELFWLSGVEAASWPQWMNATFLWEVLIAVHWYFQIMNFGKFQSSSVCKGPVEGGVSKKVNPKRDCNSPFSGTEKSKPPAFSPREVTQCRVGTVTFLHCHRWINPHWNKLSSLSISKGSWNCSGFQQMPFSLATCYSVIHHKALYFLRGGCILI